MMGRRHEKATGPDTELTDRRFQRATKAKEAKAIPFVMGLRPFHDGGGGGGGLP